MDSSILIFYLDGGYKMKYKDFIGTIDIDKDRKILYGDIVNIEYNCYYEGKTIDELEVNFKKIIDNLEEVI